MTFLSFILRLMGIVLKPRPTLKRLAYEPGAWAPIILIAVAVAVARIAMLPQYIEQYSTPEFTEQFIELRGVDAEQAEKEIALVKNITPALLILESPLMVIFGILFFSLILQILCRLQFKMQVPFILLYRMTAWVMVVSAIPLFLTVPLKLINPAWEVPTSLYFFLPKENLDVFWGGLTKVVDVFFIWEVALISIGLSAMLDLPIEKTTSAVGTLLLVIVLTNLLLMSIV